MNARQLAVALLELQAEHPDEPLEVTVQVPYDDEGEPMESFAVIRAEIKEWLTLSYQPGNTLAMQHCTHREIVLRSYD